MGVGVGGCDTNDQSCRADSRNAGYFIDDSGVYAPDGSRQGSTWSGGNANKNTQPSGPYVPPASIGAAPPPGLTPAQAQAYLKALAATRAAAAANQIPSGPGGSYVIPIAMLISKGKSMEQAIAEVMGAAVNTITQGLGPAGGPITGPGAVPVAAGGSSSVWLWGAVGLGALLLLRKH